jgi:hypothetical protein
LNYHGQVHNQGRLAHFIAQREKLFFLLFIFMLPFQRVIFLRNDLFGIQGAKPSNLLSAIVLAYLLFRGTSPLRATDEIELRSLRIFLLYFAIFTIALIRSIPNAALFHSRFPDVFPESYFDYILSACIVPSFLVLPFLFVLTRMCSFQEIDRITTLICLSILLLSVAFIILVLMNPSVLSAGSPDEMAELVSSNRDDMGKLCETYFGIYYNTIGTIYICTMPLLLYKALTRNAFWSIPLGVSLVAVLLLQSRSALIAVAISYCLLLIQRRKYLILIVGATAIGIVSLLWIGPTIDALLSVGFQNGSGFSANALLTDRVSLIWVPLVDEWTSNIGLFLFGAGRFGMITSRLWYTGALYHATHAHNAFIDFFLDNGAILSVVLIIFLFAGIVAAWRAGRRLDSDLYWALFAGFFGFGIGMMTEREIFPTVDNMYVFPIIAMMINLVRLRYLFQPEDDVWLDADQGAAAEADRGGEHQVENADG